MITWAFLFVVGIVGIVLILRFVRGRSARSGQTITQLLIASEPSNTEQTSPSEEGLARPCHDQEHDHAKVG